MRVTGSHPEQPQTAAPSAAISQPEFAWLLLWLVCVIAIVAFPAWQVIPFDLIWIGLAALYGFTLWPNRRMLALTATALVTTAAAISDDALRHLRFGATAEQIPLLATIFLGLAWQANRRIAARDRARIAAEAQRLLLLQRQFLQDASHQLRTPITIALGHAELLAAALAGRQERDIHIVVGELERLKALSERLLLVAAAENPDFLSPASADLDLIAAELFLRWQPTAARRWKLGQVAPVTAVIDAERLGLALDALIENAVRHTGTEDEITISVIRDSVDQYARIVVEDSGEGIVETAIPHIFDRFRSFGGAGSRGTGLGLALVRAVARGHGGEVTVTSALGQGSRFELALPVGPVRDETPHDQVLIAGQAWRDRVGQIQQEGIVQREAW
ncbi:MAG TPA: HAMP domain-containing sensor histidine kinase [Streptosporangiaceae bacterium]|nr:HAMP domain-containing sensor histidine kinase [Streptosporangiaceae bacterium]